MKHRLSVYYNKAGKTRIENYTCMGSIKWRCVLLAGKVKQEFQLFLTTPVMWHPKVWVRGGSSQWRNADCDIVINTDWEILLPSVAPSNVTVKTYPSSQNIFFLFCVSIVSWPIFSCREGQVELIHINWD